MLPYLTYLSYVILSPYTTTVLQEGLVSFRIRHVFDAANQTGQNIVHLLNLAFVYLSTPLTLNSFEVDHSGLTRKCTAG